MSLIEEVILHQLLHCYYYRQLLPLQLIVLSSYHLVVTNTGLPLLHLSSCWHHESNREFSIFRDIQAYRFKNCFQARITDTVNYVFSSTNQSRRKNCFHHVADVTRIHYLSCKLHVNRSCQWQRNIPMIPSSYYKGQLCDYTHLVCGN